jgi:hypothetical protein
VPQSHRPAWPNRVLLFAGQPPEALGGSAWRWREGQEIEVRLRQLSDFLRDHREEIHPSLHPTCCPAWSRKVELPA